MLSIRSQSFMLKSNRHMEHHERVLQSTFRHLASGIRIEQAKDDVAGSMIAERLTAQIRGALQHQRNIMEGISLVQVLDGSLQEQEKVVMRMRELAVAAASEHLTVLEREFLNQEFTQLQEALDQIGAHTQYNGIHLLNRSHQHLHFQIGDVSEDTFSLSLYDARVEELGRQARYDGARRGVFVEPISTGQVTLNGVVIRGTEASDDQISYSHANGSAIAKAAAINAASEFTGVEAIVQATQITGFEPIRALTLSTQDYFKINGHAISGFSIEDKDATGSLETHINAAFEHTGVVATVTQEGYLTLTADDGRNITIEYSNLGVRNALRIVDTFGDPTNLVNTVDPVIYNLDGDIDTVDFVLDNTSTYDEAFAIQGDVTINGVTSIDQSGGYGRVRDRVDYVLEVVNPGSLGVATFRFKEESVADGVVDGEPEDYLFNAKGVTTVSDPSRLSIDPNSYYNEASHRTFTLTVTKSGFVNAANAIDLPEFTVSMQNDDEASDQFVSGPFVAQSGVPIDLGYDLDLDFVFNNKVVTVGANTVNDGNSIGNPSVEPANHTYSLNPTLVDWDGDRTTDFTIEVLSTGHAVGGSDLTGANAPDEARIQITATERSTGIQTISAHDVVPNQNITVAGLTLRFPFQKGSTTLLDSHADNGSYEGTIRSNSRSTFVGSRTRYYEIEATQDGVLTNGSGPQANVYVYDSDGVTLLETDVITLRSNTNIELGDHEFEGARIRFNASNPRETDLGQSIGSYEGAVNFTGGYSGVTDEVGIFEINNSGLVGGDATYLYYYESDPATILSSGTVNANQALADGISINVGTQAQTANISQDSQAAVTFNFDDTGYTQEQNGSFTMEVFDDAGQQKLRTNWTLTDGSHHIFEENLIIAGNTNTGFGTTINIQQIPQNATTFSGNIDVNALEANDTWRVQLEADSIQSGDRFLIRANPRSIEVGTEWELTGEVPEWQVGETMTVKAAHNFTNQIIPLTAEIDLTPYDSPLEKVQLTGNGTFNTGDEIRIKTRAYIGNATSSGFYTHNLYPTNYIVTITEAGSVGNAKFDWVREDQRTDSEFGGSGSGVSHTNPTLLEEGVLIAFDGIDPNHTLTKGDQFIIPAGLKLEYTFAGQVTLLSHDNIEIEYDAIDTDNLMGRIAYIGTDEKANEAGTDGNLQQAILGHNTTRSFDEMNLLTTENINEAISTLDISLNHLSHARIKAGAVMNRLLHAHAVTGQQAETTTRTRQQIQESDVAVETALLAKSLVQQESIARLIQVHQFNQRATLNLLDESLFNI